MTFVTKAQAAWGADLPDWVAALARECDRTSQNKAAEASGYTAGVVSAVLGRSYAARMDGIEEAVRGAFMRETRDCPILGEINKQVCRDWRKRAGDFTGANTLAVTMFRACSSCPIFKEEDQT